MEPDPPALLFLDTCIVQYMHTFGEFIFDGGAPGWREVQRLPIGPDELYALRLAVVRIQCRSTPVAISSGTVAEVAESGNASYLQYTFELAAYWSGFAIPRPSARLLPPSIGYLSLKDRGLIEEAVALGCDGFLTTDRAIIAAAPHLSATAGLSVLTPRAYLATWA